jgi:hypothetical protein
MPAKGPVKVSIDSNFIDLLYFLNVHCKIDGLDLDTLDSIIEEMKR